MKFFKIGWPVIFATILFSSCNQKNDNQQLQQSAAEDTIAALPDIDYENPLKIPMLLAGNFGELRPNHFHTGLDIKTCGDEGLPVYAVAEGFISRIAVSPSGYGNTVYIDHPNGYTSVYAHLWRFSTELQSFIRELQYKKQSYAIDSVLPRKKFRVKAGELVAFSGNTGGSRAPHLHFEIRETKSENPVNPLLHGYYVADSSAPTLRAVKIYPLDSNSYVKIYYGSSSRPAIATLDENLTFFTKLSGNSYIAQNVSKIEAFGTIGFAIQAHDTKDSTYNIFGIYSVDLKANEEMLYSYKMDELNFETWRYINAHIDHREWAKSRRRFERSWLLPNNKLKIYSSLKNNGKLSLEAGKKYSVQYTLADVQQNKSILNFEIQAVEKRDSTITPTPKKYDVVVPVNDAFTFRRDGFFAAFPANALYEPAYIEFGYKPYRGKTKAFSGIYSFGDTFIPFQEDYVLALKAENLPQELQHKACIVSTYGIYQGGTYDTGWVMSKVKTFGKFFITTDVLAPVIKPINIRNGMNMKMKHSIDFYINDNLSGIKGWRGQIDGQWVVFSYEPKKHLLSYDFDEYCPPGQHSLTLEVWDDKDNKQTVTYTFTK